MVFWIVVIYDDEIQKMKIGPKLTMKEHVKIANQVNKKQLI